MGIPARFHAWDSKNQQWRYAAGTVCELSIVLTGAAFYHKVRAKASSTLHRRNLKTEVSLWKRIKCFPSTLSRMNLKREVSHRKRIKCFLSMKPEKFENATVIRSFWICVLRKHGQGNHVIIVTSSFSKSSVFKMVFSPHENEKPTLSN